MKKLSFYPRLAAGNLWRNKNTYGPYLLACIVSIFTFYTMLAISFNGALDGMRGESIVKSFTAVGSVILAIFCGILIFYTNSFLIKRRKKEMGLYSVLGMEKKNIAVLMLFETLFLAAGSLIAGLGLGLLLSKLLFWVLLRMVRFQVMLDMPLSPIAISITVAFFFVVFMLALLRNLLQVQIANPINLIAGAKQGEKEPKASWLMTSIGLLCLAGGYFTALYFTSPLDVLMFFLLAVALVIIGTYCLFTTGSVAVLKLLRRNKKYYYNSRHFISVSGMIYRMKQNAAGLATICILSCMVLVTVSGTVSLNVGAEDSLKVQFPYEYDLTFKSSRDADDVLAGLEDIASQSGVVITDLWYYSGASFVATEADGVFTSTFDDSALSMGEINVFELLLLEEYNRNEGLDITLEEDGALIFVTGGRYDENKLTLNGLDYNVTPIATLAGQKSGAAAIGRGIVLVLPDRNAADMISAAGNIQLEWERNICFNIEGSGENKQLFHDMYASYINELRTDEYFHTRVQSESREDWFSTNGGFLFLGVYFGILFMLAAALIIYYKQMSEGYDDAARFEILQKVGMSEDEVRRIINRQVLTVFFMPLAVAVVHMTVAFFPISKAMIIFGVINIPLLAVSSLLTVLAYALVYLLVFRRTARVYFGIVRRKGTVA